MRDFVKLSPAFWSSKAGKALRKAGPAAQLLALYLVSNPHGNWIGVYSLPLAYMSIDTGLDADTVTDALAACEAAGFAKYDADAEVVWVVDGAKEQIGDELKAADKRVGAVQKEFDAIPDCLFVADFFKKYGAAFHLRAPTGMEAAAPFEAAAAAPAKEVAPAPVATPAAAPAVREITPPSADDVACLKAFMFAREANDLPMTPADLAPVLETVQQLRNQHGEAVLDKVLRLATRSEDYSLEDVDVYLGFLQRNPGAEGAYVA